MAEVKATEVKDLSFIVEDAKIQKEDGAAIIGVMMDVQDNMNLYWTRYWHLNVKSVERGRS